MNAAAEHALELGAGAGADLLDAPAALAEHDRLLAVALDMDGLRDLDAAIGEFLPTLGLDDGRVGQFLLELEKDLLARRFGGDEALRQVGELVLGIKPRAFRQRRR